MQPKLFLVGLSALGLLVFATNATSSGQSGALIRLQSSTPGVQQPGHGNISGSFRAGAFFGNGAGLTNVSLTLPYVDSSAPGLPNAAFRIDSTGTGGGIYGTHGSPTGTPTSGFGVLGRSGTDGMGVWGASMSGYGVFATSFSGIGVVGRSFTGPYAIHGSNLASNQVSIFGEATGDNSTGVKGEGAQYGLFGEGTGSAGIAYGVFGQTADTDGFGVKGLATALTGFNVGVGGESASATGQGVFGRATDTTSANIGVYGWASGTSGKGVYGLADSSTGNTMGVHGIASSTSGRGVYGVANSLTGINYGVYGLSSSSTGFGVYGLSGASSGLAVGVKGATTAPGGRAVEGSASSTSGSATAGYFSTAALNGYGLYALATSATASTSYGIYAESAGTSQSYGAYFVSEGTSGRGVYGAASASTGATYGVRGQSNSSSGYGVFSVGDMGTSGAKAFVIDHPADPENKYLRHYCAEGPVPLNIYQGEVTTDEKGFAWVELPSYYDLVNKDAKIQLTVVDEGDDFVMAKVSKRVQNGKFQLRTSQPGVTVYWEVKAERNDPWMRAHPPKVEYAKDENERGKYQHPSLYGMPDSMAMDSRPVKANK
ncbi:MAG TPA: hypothetical protein PKA27_04355 [Fimbriimonadaceae bacterium]|nr:hypothetical protein [Fimbriimonadaceae bacterium]